MSPSAAPRCEHSCERLLPVLTPVGASSAGGTVPLSGDSDEGSSDGDGAGGPPRGTVLGGPLMGMVLGVL